MAIFQNSNNDITVNSSITSVSANYTVLLTDVTIEVTSTASARTITLPAPSTTGSAANKGKYWIIKDTSGGAATNNITIAPASGTIDGGPQIVISYNYGFAQVFSDGTSYFSSSLFSLPSSGGLTWQGTSSASITASANNGYILNSSSAQTISLPTTGMAVGSVVEVVQTSAGTSALFTIAQTGSTQTIQYGAQVTTQGTTGSLVATQPGNAIRIVCTTANTTFQVLSSTGNLIVN